MSVPGTTTAIPAAATVGLLATLAAAQAVAVDVDRALAELAVPARQWEAGLALVRSGAANVLPRLQALLRAHHEREAGSVTMALLVAGRLARDALPLLPELLEVYRMSLQPDVRRQALWAVGQVAPFASPEERARAQQFVLAHFAPDGDRFLFECVDERIGCGHELDPGELLARVRSRAGGSARVIAAAEALAMLPRERLAADEAVLPVLLELLAARLARPMEPWEVDTTLECEAPAIAAAAWAAGDRSAVTARGLLQHWDPELRLAGLTASGRAASAIRAERWDVVLVVWDRVPAVRDLALATMRGWDDGFVMAVPSLLALVAGGADRAFAAASSHAIQRWLATAPPVAAAAIAALRGEPVPDALPAPTAADRAQVAQLLLGCRALGNGELSRLAPFVRRCGLANGEVVDALLWCVATTNAAAWRDAIGALITVGPAVTTARPELALALVRSGALTGSFVFAPIVDAWVRAGPGATTADLARAAASDDWLVTARALAETVQRGGVPPAALVDAALVARTTRYEDVRVDQGQEWSRRRGRGWSYVVKKADPQLVPALATLVLLAAGDERWRDATTLERCLTRFGAETTPESLLAAKARGDLAGLAVRLEQELRPEGLTGALPATLQPASPAGTPSVPEPYGR